MSDYNEDDEIEKAKARSLLTVKEDEKRRQQKYAGLNDVPPTTSTSNQSGGSFIARPRPFPRNVSRENSPQTALPTVPPRPDPHRVEQARLSTQKQQASSPKRSIPNATTTGSALSTAPSSSRNIHINTSQAHVDDKPLIVLSSPVPSSKVLDFDLDSLDPLKSSSTLTSNTNEPQPPRPASAQNLFATSRADFTRSGSTGEITKPPVSTATTGNWVGFTDSSYNSSSQLPYSLSPFNHSLFGPGFQQQKPFSVQINPSNSLKPFSQSMPYVSWAVSVPPAQTNALNQGSSNTASFNTLYTSGVQPPAARHGKLSLSPAPSASLADSSAKMPRVPSDSSLLVLATNSRKADTTDFRRTPSSDLFDPTAVGIPVDFDKKERTSSSTSNSDDLITFTDPFGVFDEQCLSLESFDPLFSMDKIGDPMVDSTGLYANPFQTSFSSIGPSSSALTTQDILTKVNSMSGVRHYNTLDASAIEARLQEGSTASAKSDSTESQHKRTDSTGSGRGEELLDPFSISDLTSALEKKRKRHAQEQEARKALLRKKPPPRPPEPEPSATGHQHATGSEREAAATAVKRREKKPREAHHRYARTSSYLPKVEESTYETLQSYKDAAADKVKAFCDMVARLKLDIPYNSESNVGFYWAPLVQHTNRQKDLTVKVIVTGAFIHEPCIFTPSLDAAVSLLVCEVLLSLADSLESTCADDYLLKVHGVTEYLKNDAQLGHFEYVHNCLKTDEDIRLVLVDRSKVALTLLRTEADDALPVLVPKHREIEDPALRVTIEKLNILTETYYGEVEKLRDSAITAGGCTRVRSKGVVQAVKAICATLYKIETADVVRAVGRLQSITAEGLERKRSTRESFVYVTHDGREMDMDHNHAHQTSAVLQLDDLHVALEELTRAVKGQIDLFCRTFQTGFSFASRSSNVKEKRCLSELDETLLLHVASAHRIPAKLKATYDSFRLRVGVYYAGKPLCDDVMTQQKARLAAGLQDTYIWDEWVHLETVVLRQLPRESRLCLELIGFRTVQATSSSDPPTTVATPLGWVALQLFNHKFELVQGSHLLGLWMGHNLDPLGTSQPSTEWSSSLLLQVNLPDFDCDYYFPTVMDPPPSVKEAFSDLHPMDQEQLSAIWERDSTFILTPDTLAYMWEKRHYLSTHARALPRVLQAAPCWRPDSLRHLYWLMGDWTPLEPTVALQLLLPIYPDTFVRTKAVEWISVLADDEIIDYLPQLIQALKFESYHTSALARMLIQRSITCPRFAHQFYWLLKEAADDMRYRKRYQLMFGALLSVVGEAARAEFGREETLVKRLAAVAEKVKAAKEKENVLQRELYNMSDLFPAAGMRLPLNPAMHVSGLDVKSCSYFSSNAFPLKLVFKNIDPKAEPIYVMFKSGDDLRQDMLTMQMIRVMDKLWLKAGLDLKMVTFRCQATGIRRGFVELVTESDTLRKIQIKHGRGVAGSFKETTIRESLQHHNPTQLEFDKAVSNFTASCAGYCVATYLLGICDRHNDNIMVKHSGHLFHIDFGKFLGDSQMFGNIKRDRTPFVLTSDMAYVINGGDKMSSRFQHFVDFCSQAFNVLRKHSNFFVNLFQLMVHSSIPGVNEAAVAYVQRALLPDHTDAEATAVFTRMIEESLKSTFTQVNFFIHNLAQMKFSGHSEGALLSFIPKTYSINTDGRIKHIELTGIQKRYNPEKYYIYIIRVERENQRVASFIFRRYSEFQELHHKLVCLFPLVRLPPLTNKVILGRTHVKTVAEERKLELQVFLRGLLSLAPEISEHDVVYTFFHPMLRDEQDTNTTNVEKLREPTTPRPQLRKIEGQIKLSIFYKHDELTVMIMHVKDLAGLAGNAPDPYVKLYLLPDPFKQTKRKTKIAKSTFHPTYNEMLCYRLLFEEVKARTLSVSVWNFDSFKENEFLGCALIPLSSVDLSTEYTAWYSLSPTQVLSSSPSPHTLAPAIGTLA